MRSAYALICAVVVLSLVICSVSAADMVLTTGEHAIKNTKVSLNEDNSVTYTSEDLGLLISAKPDAKLKGGESLKPKLGEKELTLEETKMVSGDPIFLYKYLSNSSLKETITIPSDSDISWSITIPYNEEIVPYMGGYRVIPKGTLSQNPNAGIPSGIQIQAPTAVDANGLNIPIQYDLNGNTISLIYNHTYVKKYNESLTNERNIKVNSLLYPQYDTIGIVYPITIDPTYYPANYAPYLKLSVHFNSSPYYDDFSHTIVSSNIAANTSNKPFGAASGYIINESVFNVTSGLTDFSYGTNNFTIAMWLALDNKPNAISGVFRQYDSTLGFGPVIVTGGTGSNALIAYNDSMYGITQSFGMTNPKNTFIQVVLERAANTLYFYVNGTLVGTQIETGSYTNNNNLILAQYSDAPHQLTGVDELAIWNGVAIPIATLYPQSAEFNSGTIPPVASFSGIPTTGFFPLTVQFNDSSTYTPTNWNWDFGDGNYTGNTTRNASHVYTSAGTYSVSLNVTNAGGSDTQTRTNYISVSTPFWVSSNGCWTATLGSRTLRMWNTTGTSSWPIPTGVTTANVLIVGGGGSGGEGDPGASWGAGGGAGGVLNGTLTGLSGTYTIVVGTGGTAISSAATNGVNGTNSSFGSYVAIGGAGGAGAHGNGLSGGSGSGATYSGTGGASTQTTQSPLTGYGYAGGGTNSHGGGGGGAGGLGGTFPASNPAAGGIGVSFNITGTPTTYATGGGSEVATPVTGVNGLGDGGGGNHQASSGAGGSGVVIISYELPTIPKPIFTSNVTTGKAPLAVQFYDISTIVSPTMWNWSFGDTTWSNQTSAANKNVSKSYSSSGTFTVNLSVTNATGSSFNTSSITVWNDVLTGFTANATTTVTGAPVVFTVTHPSDNATSWDWNFGDVTGWHNGTTQNYTYTYNTVGVFNVTEAAHNSNSNSSTTQTNYITVWGGLVGGFSANATYGFYPTPFVVNFTASDSASNASTYNWTFGDGYSNYGNNRSITHQYSNAGTYDVSLVDGNPAASVTTNYTGYISYLPAVSLTVNSTSGLYPLVVILTDTSGWTNPLNRVWNFGDGVYFNDSSLNTSSNVTHVYYSPGTYQPSLTLTNGSFSSTGYYQGYVVVYGGSSQFSTQHTTRWTCQNWAGDPIVGMNVSIMGMNSTYLQNWVFSMFNLNMGAVPLTSTFMSGVTGSDGGITFATLPGTMYQVNFSKPSLGIHETNYYSSDESEITVTFWPEPPVLSTAEFKYAFWNTPVNTTAMRLGINYSDPNPYQNNVTFYVMNSQKQLVTQSSSFNNTGQNWSYDVPIQQGKTYYWGLNINSTGYKSPIKENAFIRFNASQWLVNPLGATDGDPWATWVYQLASIAFVGIIAAVPGRRSIKMGVITLAISAGIMFYFGWLQITSLVMTGVFFFAIVMYLRRGEEESST
jgi:PKD repeat protein